MQKNTKKIIGEATGITPLVKSAEASFKPSADLAKSGVNMLKTAFTPQNDAQYIVPEIQAIRDDRDRFEAYLEHYNPNSDYTKREEIIKKRQNYHAFMSLLADFFVIAGIFRWYTYHPSNPFDAIATDIMFAPFIVMCAVFSLTNAFRNYQLKNRRFSSFWKYANTVPFIVSFYKKEDKYNA